MKLFASVFTLLLLCCSVFAQQSQTINSPDGKITVTVNIKDKLSYSIKHEGDVLLAPSPISMKLQDGEIFGVNPKLKKIDKESMSQMIKAPIYKRLQIKDEYNELVLSFKGDYAVVFSMVKTWRETRGSASRVHLVNVGRQRSDGLPCA